jgi:ferrous iron transport protein A
LFDDQRKDLYHLHHGRARGRVEGLPLCMAGRGMVVRVVGIRAGGGLTRKLADMGLVPGEEIRLVNCQGAGPVLIDLKGSRLALGRGMAMKVIVEEV